MFLEVVLGWVAIGLFAYFFAMFGMDRIYGEYKQDLLTLEKKVKNPRNCPVCKQNLTTWFSQCVSCSSCDLRTCRSCADYNQVVGEWTCQYCVHLRNNKDAGWDGVSRTSSKFWYDDILNKSGSLAQYSVPQNTHVDRTASLRYEQLEDFVAHYLTITPEELNHTDVGKIYRDSKYDLLFSRYHEVVSIVLEELLRTSSDRVKESVSLSKLKELMNKIKVAAKLDLVNNMEVNPRRKVGGGARSYEPSYPDILSTAILNRIIIDSQAKSSCSISPISNDSAVIVDYSSTSTDLPESGSEKDTHNWVLSTTTEETSVLRTSDDESIVDTPGGQSIESTWSTENATPQASLKIEESIEEITTQMYETTSEDSGTSSSDSGDEHDYADPKSPRSVIQENVANWEHNFLFARRKELLKKRKKLLQEPVSMYVPNPTAGDAEVMIGNEKASDLEDDLDSLDVGQLGYVVVEAKGSDTSGSDPESPKRPVPAEPEPLPVPSPQAKTTSKKLKTPKPQSQTAENFKHEPINVTTAEIPVPAQRATVTVGTASVVSTASVPEAGHEASQVKLVILEESNNHRLEDTTHDKSSVRTESTHNETKVSIVTATVTVHAETSSSDSEAEKAKLPPMRIAEREKEKWNHPVNIKNNPYAAENLNKRLREQEFISLHSVAREDDSDAVSVKTDNFSVERRSLEKFRRDYYVPKSSGSEDRKSSSSSTSSEGDFAKFKQESATVPTADPPAPTKPTEDVQPLIVAAPRRTVVTSKGIPDAGADLVEIKLPSVRNLAKKFSSPIPEEKVSPTREVSPKTSWKPTLAGSNAASKQQIHSLTARSVSREFREGLRLSKPAITNYNIKISDTNF